MAIASAALALAYAALFWFLRNPTLRIHSHIDRVDVDVARLRRDVSVLASIEPNRSIENPDPLIEAANYIEAELSETGCAIERHAFVFEHARDMDCGPRGDRGLIGATFPAGVRDAGLRVLKRPRASTFPREIAVG